MMIKRLAVLAALAGAALFFFTPPGVMHAADGICDTQQSTLCSGLSAVFQFEEDQDTARVAANSVSTFREADGQNVARAAGKVDSYAVSFVGTDGNYLWMARAGSVINGSTVAMWIYPTSAAAEQIVISADEATKHGPYLSLVPSGGAVKVKGVAYYGDGRGDVSVTSTATMSLNSWHLVVWGYDQAEAADFLTSADTGRVMYVQIDNGARDKVGLAYFPVIGPFNDLILGQRKGTGVGYTLPYSGRLDQLTLVGRTWDSIDVTEFYNGAAGKAFPFVPTTYAGLNSGLVAYWKLEEATSTLYDAVGQANLTPASVTAGTAAKVGNGFSNADGQYVYVATTAAVEVPGTDFTVGGWFKPAMASTGYAGKAGEWLIEFTPSTGTRFYVYAGTQCTTPSVSGLTNGTWYFVVADWNNTTKTCRLTVNNGTPQTSTSTGSITASANQFRIGAATGYEEPQGTWDEWFLYKRQLTTQEKTDLYNSGTGRTYPF